jgi:hypothetical protein
MFLSRYGTAAKLGAILGAIALIGVVTWLAMGYAESAKSRPAIEVVDKYLGGYRDANLKAVKDSVSVEMMESLATSQTVFANEVKSAAEARPTAWTITSVETNEYTGQSLVRAQVKTGKGTTNVEIEVFDYSEGLRVRNVKDLDNPAAGTGVGSGTETTGAPQGMGGTVPGNQSR